MGRGVAESCGLSWQVPEKHYAAFLRGRLHRRHLVQKICAQLRRKQADLYAQQLIDTSPLERLVGLLPSRYPGWNHLFSTTNWDTVIDRALAPHGVRVWHLNGSIEEAGGFLTEIDPGDARRTLGAAPAELLSADAWVVAGLSLKSALDRDLVASLCEHERRIKTGVRWLVVNPNRADTLRIAALLRDRMPGSHVSAITMGFSRWVANDLPGLEFATAVQPVVI